MILKWVLVVAWSLIMILAMGIQHSLHCEVGLVCLRYPVKGCCAILCKHQSEYAPTELSVLNIVASST